MLPSPVQGPCVLQQGYWDRPAFYRPFGLAAHGGLDISSPTPGLSVPVCSPVEGVVIKAGWDGGYGLAVRVLTPLRPDGTRREVLLGHFASIDVGEGQVVSLGQRVGMMGQTGDASGVHVHWAHRLQDPHGNILNLDNGFKGYLAFGPDKLHPYAYVLWWGDPVKCQIVTFA